MTDDLETLTKLVNFYGDDEDIAALERLEKEMARQRGQLVQKARFEWNDNQMRMMQEENDAIRAKLEKAKEALVAFMKMAWDTHHSRPEYDAARAVLAELSADDAEARK